MDLDRVLLASVKRNLSVARHLAADSSDPVLKAALEKFLTKHILTTKDMPSEKPVIPEPMTEKDKRIYRLTRYLSVLSDTDMRNLLELAKSMNRMRKESDPAEMEIENQDQKIS